MYSITAIAFLLAFFTLGGSFIIWGLLNYKWKRLIENIPTSKIRSIAMGLVEIFGNVVSKDESLLKSPFTQNPCVYYKYKIEELRSSGKSTHWVTIKKGEENRLFFLQDDTGRVLVNATGAIIRLSKDTCYHSELGNDPPESVQQFIKSIKVDFEGFLGINKTMKYTEWYIAPGDNLYIIGTATDNPFVEEASVEQGVEDVMITKGDHEKFYYIADKKESTVLASFTKYTYSGIVLGLLFIALALLSIYLFGGGY